MARGLCTARPRGSTVDALVEGMFSRFRVPQSIHSDQGHNFESKVFMAMCEQLSTRRTRTNPLHTQRDGFVERFSHTLVEQLAIRTSMHQNAWDKYFPCSSWHTTLQSKIQPCAPHPYY